MPSALTASKLKVPLMRQIPLLVAILAWPIGGCRGSESSTYRLRERPFGLDVTVRHVTGAPLSAEEDEVYVTTGEGEELIFKGYGGSRPKLIGINPDTIIILYCGGSIITTKSSISPNKTNEEPLSIIRIQPITVSGLTAAGQQLCRPKFRGHKIPGTQY